MSETFYERIGEYNFSIRLVRNSEGTLGPFTLHYLFCQPTKIE
jgi:hypothetical protein